MVDRDRRLARNGLDQPLVLRSKGSRAARTRTNAPSRFSWARSGAASTVFDRRSAPVTL